MSLGRIPVWPQDHALSESVERTLEQRGPSDAVVRWLGARLRTQGLELQIVEPSLPYRVSDDPVLVQGAITAVTGYHANLEFEDHPELKARVADAMLAAANRLTEDADRQAIAVYVGAFLNNPDVRAAPILWRWVDTGLSFESALSAIIRLARPEDLPRMTTFITATEQSHDTYFTISHLISDIYEAYGAESIPYLVRALKETDSQRVRMRSARMLIQEDQPTAWAFVVAVLESGYRQKGQLIREINDLYPKLNADETAILELAKHRAAQRTIPREGGTSPR